MKKYVLFLLIFGQSLVTLAQTGTKLNVVPPSPEASSLIRTDFSDVNLYTGKVNYSIPLYTIQTGNLSFPISLNYTGGNGIKVSEIASSAGLGWSLSYTGVISRTIRGLADDVYKSSWRGYIYMPPFPNPGLPENFDIYDKYSQNIYDAEPDIYNLNVAGISVSFYLNRDKTPNFIEKTDVKVVPVFTGYVISGFEVTGVDGIKYIFEEIEESRTEVSGGAPSVDTDYYTTAWYLKRIVSPYGVDLLTFNYSSKDSYFSQYDIIAPYRFIPFGSTFNETSTLVSTFYVHKPLLNQIIFPSGEVLFTRSSSNRLDLNGDKALSTVIVKNNASETIKSYSLHHSYFGPSGGNEEEMRLKLDSLSEHSSTGRKLNYSFEYENTYSLPARMPRGLTTKYYHEDHWGYYNGIANTSYEAKNRIKYYQQPFPLQPIDTLITEFGTANREANASYGKTGMLKKVKLPTGGYAEFDYEGHSSNDERLPNTISLSSALNLTYDEQPNNFSIATIREPFAYATVSGLYGTGFEAIFSIYASGSPLSPLFTDTIGGTNNSFKYMLKPGAYFIKAKQTGFPVDTSDLNMLTLRKEIETLLPQKPVGGLRIKQSRLIDPVNGVQLKRDYIYTADGTQNAAVASSGTIANAPQYGLQFVGLLSQGYSPDYFNFFYKVPQNYIRQLQSTYPLNPTQGSDVGYAKVWTLDNDSLQTEYNFTSYNDFLEMADGYRDTPLSGDDKLTIDGKKFETYPIAPYDERDFLRGRALSVIQYKKGSIGFDTVQKQENTYTFNIGMPTITKNGLIIHNLPDTVEYVEGMILVRYPLDPGNPMTTYYTGFKNHRMYTGRYDLKKSITTVYHTASDSTRSEVDYTYGDSPWVLTSNFHYQPTEIAKTTSEGVSELNKLYYAYDGYLTLPQWDSHDLSTFTALSLQNRVSDPVLTLNYRNSKLVSGFKQVYQNFTTQAGTTLDVSSILKYNTSSLVFETQAQINQRNKFGNIVESRDKLSPSSTYLYSYNGQYPVAELKNASYAAVEGVLGLTTINNFSDLLAPAKTTVDAFLAPLKTALPSAEISSFVYRSLIGMSSTTDAKGMSTYFEHDDFHRLSVIKNQDGDIIKTYCYTYTGQLTDCNFNSDVTYYNTAQSANFTRNNCTGGAVGSTVTYTIAAGTYSSTVSQAAADALAQAALSAGGQAYANANGTCLYYNTAQSGNFTRNDCNAGGVGGTVLYTIAAGTYSSTVSQAAADALALAAVNAGGQAYANANANCTYYNTAQSGYFTRNDCGSGGTGGTVLYTIPAYSYSSTVSQAAANAQAQAALNAGGQAYANANADCTYYNSAQSGNFTRNNCATGGTGGTVNYTIPAGSYSSTVSQADANAQAQAALSSEGQAYANANASCTWYNATQSRSFKRNNCAPGQTTDWIAYTVPAGTYSSNISQADANDQAATDIDNNGQAYANANGVCVTVYWNVQKSQVFIKNDCPSGYNGSSVTYTVAAGTYSSTVSQAAADSQAQSDVSANGQTYANTNGSCSASTITITYNNQTKLSGGVPSSEIYQVSFSSGGSPVYNFTTAQLKVGVNIAPGTYDVSFNVNGSPYDPITQLGWGSITLGGGSVNYSDYPPSVYYINGLSLSSNSTITLRRLEI